MRFDAKMMCAALLLSGCALLAGCGGKEQTSNVVQMKDLEVVDGTTSDAMTDLDGVRTEGAPTALPTNASNAVAPATPPKEEAEKPAGDTEVLSDQ